MCSKGFPSWRQRSQCGKELDFVRSHGTTFFLCMSGNISPFQSTTKKNSQSRGVCFKMVALWARVRSVPAVAAERAPGKERCCPFALPRGIQMTEARMNRATRLLSRATNRRTVTPFQEDVGLAFYLYSTKYSTRGRGKLPRVRGR